MAAFIPMNADGKEEKFTERSFAVLSIGAVVVVVGTPVADAQAPPLYVTQAPNT